MRGQPTLGNVQPSPVIETYDTEDEVVRHTSNHLSKRFRFYTVLLREII
jgi:hypothetical protein